MRASKQPASGKTVGHGLTARRFAFATVCTALLALALWIARRPSHVVPERPDHIDELAQPYELRDEIPSALNKQERAVRPAKRHLQHGSDNSTGAAGSGFDDPDAGARLGGPKVPEDADLELLEGIADELRMSIEEEQQAPVVVTIGSAAR